MIGRLKMIGVPIAIDVARVPVKVEIVIKPADIISGIEGHVCGFREERIELVAGEIAVRFEVFGEAGGERGLVEVGCRAG
jgi:hypothetical protein